MPLTVVPLGVAVGAAAGVLALVDGPLAPLDGDALRVTLPRVDFSAIVAGAIADAAPQHAALDAAHQVIAGGSDVSVVDAHLGTGVDDASYAHDVNSGAFNNADPADIIAVTNAQGHTADAGRGDWDEAPPPPRRIRDPDGEPPTGRHPPDWGTA